MTQPKRIQLRRGKGWRKPEGAVVVSRGPGKFGNPFTIAAAAEASFPDPARAAVTAFRDWLNGDPWACPSGDTWEVKRQTILQALPELRGKDLCCWCALDQPCHADVLLELANA
ncbi:DUF4326 domain-containing protein [Pseudorhodobacter sp.]|uniref:DUF4326 domain-containing protein n=1 Tax=Pseudorhodobacter sp. TaxID=1934400 RepID=UPI0026476418|nr:DUF4326 domain-containing protein [Pseudorhodobacter sp.]MDN5786518.1 DUF4326 domain-containing protein [Pseudorhodobacter sp.]